MIRDMIEKLKSSKTGRMLLALLAFLIFCAVTAACASGTAALADVPRCDKATRNPHCRRTPTPPAFCSRIQKYAQVESPLYASNDPGSEILVLVPAGGRVRVDSCATGLLARVRYYTPYTGHANEIYDGWIRLGDLTAKRVGTPLPTQPPTCYDC